jgi:rhamnose transport system ATP-binding protein
VTKRFGPVEVLSDVDLSLRGGRVHSLAGENGAGKSTIVKILAGVHRPDAGRILLDGSDIELHGAADARRHGIAVVHQHPALFPDLSVAENIFAGRQKRRLGAVDWATMRRDARALLARIGMVLDVGLRRSRGARWRGCSNWSRGSSGTGLPSCSSAISSTRSSASATT